LAGFELDNGIPVESEDRKLRSIRLLNVGPPKPYDFSVSETLTDNRLGPTPRKDTTEAALAGGKAT
jgi:hypothetical protein